LPANLEALFRELPSALPKVDASALERWTRARSRVPGVAKVGPSGSSRGVLIELEPPVAAASVATWLGLARPYAVSGDVHQRSFGIRSFTQKLAGNRIATEFPSFGAWRLEIDLDGRPEGPLPAEVSGASPAYPLGKYPASVKQVRIEPAE
jgi:hypothetical protein